MGFALALLPTAGAQEIVTAVTINNDGASAQAARALAAGSLPDTRGTPSSSPPCPLEEPRVLPPQPVSHPNPNVLERSTLFFGGHGLVVEAQIAPHLFFYDTVKKIYDLKCGHSTRVSAISFTPMIRLRNRSDTSDPIKTLSWMPKFDAQVVWAKRVDPFHSRMFTLHGTIGHHSNGQDECIYSPGILDRADLCRVPSRIQDVRINYPNGSFSTNYFRLGLVSKRYYLSQTPDPDQPTVDPVKHTFAVGAYGEFHPGWFHPFGISALDPVLRPLYGDNRVSGVVEYESRILDGHKIVSGSARLTGLISYIDKIASGPPATFVSQPNAPLNALYSPGNGSSRLAIFLEAAWNPDWLRGWGLDVRYYRGQDYYNLLFIQDIHWFQAGIVFDAAEFEPFKKLGFGK
ncbi:MAG TPA: hypothetical protein VN461_11515 [Vicinamibacteria bacterium]|nr:hypothetical protein [Vicinamibacteria bacterium]